MRLLLTTLTLFIFISTYSQVGVGTVTPKSDLHVSKTSSDGGTIQIDGGIRLGGNQTTSGSKGLSGQVLMSDGAGGNAKWVSLGKVGGYITDCQVPNNIAEIDFTLPDGSNGNAINVSSAKIRNALNSLPDGGIIVLRTIGSTLYTSINTRLTVELPSAAAVLDKPFVLAFDGPRGSNNFLRHNSIIEILVKPSENDSFVYELGTVSGNRRFTIKAFPRLASDYKVSELDNDSRAEQPILLFNSYTITAINDKTWSFTSRDCSIQNPSY